MRARFISVLKGFARCERGTQMLEFAIALPFLLLFFAGTVELGRLFYTYTTLAKATVVGARYASTKQTVAADDANVRNMVVCGNPGACGGSEAPPVAGGLAAGNVHVTAPAGAPVKYVTVSVSYDYHPVVFDLAGMTGSQLLSLDVTLTPATTMRYMK
jgi:hypothetical protein